MVAGPMGRHLPSRGRGTLAPEERANCASIRPARRLPIEATVAL
jgi:hypothetical protein